MTNDKENNSKIYENNIYIPEIHKLTTAHYLEDKEKRSKLPKIAFFRKNAIEILNKVISDFNHDIEQCKKYFCTISFSNIQNIYSDYCNFKYISIEMMPVKVILNNETKIYVDIEIYADEHFIVGREYNKMYDANPNLGSEYNIIFKEMIIDN